MPHNLVQNIDYYFDEDGLMVLTEKYHMERGSCCGNACRHCPFEYINVPEPARSRILSLKHHASQKKQKQFNTPSQDSSSPKSS